MKLTLYYLKLSLTTTFELISNNSLLQQLPLLSHSCISFLLGGDCHPDQQQCLLLKFLQKSSLIHKFRLL